MCGCGQPLIVSRVAAEIVLEVELKIEGKERYNTMSHQHFTAQAKEGMCSMSQARRCMIRWTIEDKRARNTLSEDCSLTVRLLEADPGQVSDASLVETVCIWRAGMRRPPRQSRGRSSARAAAMRLCEWTNEGADIGVSMKEIVGGPPYTRDSISALSQGPDIVCRTEPDGVQSNEGHYSVAEVLATGTFCLLA